MNKNTHYLTRVESEKLSSMIIQLESSYRIDQQKLMEYINYVINISKIKLSDYIEYFNSLQLKYNNNNILNFSDICKLNNIVDIKTKYNILNQDCNTYNLFKFKFKDGINYLTSSLNNLIYKLGHTILSTKYSNNEIYNIGYLGAYDAAINFNYKLNTKFITHAYDYIKKSFYEYKNKYNSILNYKSNLYILSNKIKDILHNNIQDINDIISTELNITINNAINTLNYLKPVISLSQPSDTDEDIIYESLIADENSLNLINNFENSYNIEIINNFLEQIKKLRGNYLGQREYDIFIKYIGLYDESIPINELAKEYNVSRDTIIQSIFKSKKIIKNFIIKYNEKYQIFSLRKCDINNTNDLNNMRQQFKLKLKNKKIKK